MGYRLYREVKRHAPSDLDTGELALLLILADEANDETRECFPGMDELCAYMRMSAVGVRKILQRLAQRGIDVRAAVGKDGTGRVVYAHKGARTTYRLPRFAPADAAPNGDTPVPPKSTQRRSAGIASDGERGDGSIAIEAQRRSAGIPKAIPQDRPSPQFPHEEDPHLLPSQRIIRGAGLGLSEDDETRFIEWTKNTYKPRTSGWWHKVATEGDLPGLVAEWRASLTPTTANGPDALPPWCGRCGTSNGTAAATNPNLRYVRNGDEREPCPDCHPDTTPNPQSQRPSTTDQRFADALAAGERLARARGELPPVSGRAGGYQPYQNPPDQSVYLEGIS